MSHSNRKRKRHNNKISRETTLLDIPYDVIRNHIMCGWLPLREVCRQFRGDPPTIEELAQFVIVVHELESNNLDLPYHITTDIFLESLLILDDVRTFANCTRWKEDDNIKILRSAIKYGNSRILQFILGMIPKKCSIPLEIMDDIPYGDTDTLATIHNDLNTVHIMWTSSQTLTKFIEKLINNREWWMVRWYIDGPPNMREKYPEKDFIRQYDAYLETQK